MRQECDTQFVSHSVHPIRCASSIGVGAHRYLPDFSTAPFAGQLYLWLRIVNLQRAEERKNDTILFIHKYVLIIRLYNKFRHGLHGLTLSFYLSVILKAMKSV